MTGLLRLAERMKLELFTHGLALSPEALKYIEERDGQRQLTLADYASTSGVTLLLDERVWVNAPIQTYNPNFAIAPRHELVVDGGALAVRDLRDRQSVPAKFTPVPAYAGLKNRIGRPHTEYVHTHSDRARLSPVQGCAMRCKFCDIPYEFKGQYYAKSVVRLLEAAEAALSDPIQPAQHFLISGGTPGRPQYDYLRTAYAALLSRFKDRVAFDIMMAPLPEVMDLDELDEVGVNELSLNVEIWDREIAARIIPQKFDQGLDMYLRFIGQAIDKLGAHRVRSILLVGLEPVESTLEGVRVLSEMGCAPVLSPFRPDPITELGDVPPPDVETLARVYLEAAEIAGRYGVKLGPRCTPCSHNTLTFDDASGHYGYTGDVPRLI